MSTVLEFVSFKQLTYNVLAKMVCTTHCSIMTHTSGSGFDHAALATLTIANTIAKTALHDKSEDQTEKTDIDGKENSPVINEMNGNSIHIANKHPEPIKREQVEESLKKEWQGVAAIFDRFFLAVHLLVTVVSLLSVLLLYY